jgi:serine/threonine protein phosphatase 1
MPISFREIEFPRRFLRPPPAGFPDERVYAIGDIHGRCDLFAELMDAIRLDCVERPTEGRQVRLIVLGDFIDRGPHSRAAIELLRRASELQGVTVLLGNHEACLLDCAAGRADPRDGWLSFGGQATLDSFGIRPPAEGEDMFDFAERLTLAIGEDSLAWLRGLALHDRSGDFFFCHAGVRPGVPLDRQLPEDLLWIREAFLSSRRSHGKIVVHGHSITDDVDVAENRIGVDTGAYASGRLTALAIEGTRLWRLSTMP